MKFAGLAEIRKELQLSPPRRLQELCLRMARYRKDNKELLAFLLFEDNDHQVFLEELRSELQAEFSELAAQGNLYYLKKGLRRILRLITRYSKYLDDKAESASLLIWFCRQIKEQGLPVRANAQLRNIYDNQLKKAETLVGALHEDLQHDYMEEIRELKSP